MIRWLGNLLGLDDLAAIRAFHVKFAAPWAQERPALVLFAAILLAVLAGGFYWRYQKVAGGKARAALFVVRAVLLALLLAILAEPVIAVILTQNPKPLLVLLFDCTDSMNIQDKLPAEDRAQLAKMIAPERGVDPTRDLSRMALIQKALTSKSNPALDDLARRFRLRAYKLEGSDQVRALELAHGEGGAVDRELLASQIKGEGQVTALGMALGDVGRQHASAMLAGVVVFSDFDKNAGPEPLPAAQRLGAPVYAVGLGPREVVDLAVDLQAPLILKKGERTSVSVRLRQTGLTGRTARVQLLARRLGSLGGASEATPLTVAPPQSVLLDKDQVSVDVPFLPEATGRFSLQARVDPFEDEVLEENNTAEREVTIRDEALKLLFVENEPTWEWRFIKEVFHRDPLIGREGFRTFLQSADFSVRRTNELFVESLVQPRAEFFAHDMVFLSDVPAELLSGQFQDMLREYVANFGGGLVVLAGPRWGPTALARTRLADMLPVVVDPNATLRNSDFALQLTPMASQYEFMNLGATREENQRAWANLGQLHWYQPVAQAHPLATVLAQHPTDRCVDGRTPMPLIAVRRFGKGEVIYFGFNETWRLRRKYGEKYYRQLWGQMIYHLGLGRALGSQKRFLAYTDRRSYQAGEKVRVTVEAYNADFEPLDTQMLGGRVLVADGGTTGSTTVPAGTSGGGGGGATVLSELSIPMARDKVIYEATFPVFASGSYRLLVRDPVANQDVEVNFKVAPVTAERRSAVRNVVLQHALADQTGGKAYELWELNKLTADVTGPRVEQTSERRFALWNTWLVLGTVLTLMLGEWFARKLLNLR